MKFRVTMKDPDALHECVADAVNDELANEIRLDDEEREAISEMRQRRAMETACQWFKYSEYVTIEIDTEAGTATVCLAE